MATALVFSLVLQQLIVAPSPCEVGVPVVVRATDGEKPIAELAVVVEASDGEVGDVGVTDANGEVRYVPQKVDHLHFVVVRDRARWVAPLHVVPAPRRWFYAAVCMPLGLVLLWRALRRSGPRS